MATLIPTLTLSCADATTDLINFSVVDNLNITKAVIAPSKIKLSTGDLTLFAAASYTKSYVYLKNTDDTIAINIEITDGNDTIQLAAKEFAFFPWTSGSDIIAFSASGTPYLEYAIFEA
jgi:hypothetical protein|tara:strand:- start:8307 stop:8663 length:357 start_codon:yes stop_codon:yes gene_type:complete